MVHPAAKNIMKKFEFRQKTTAVVSLPLLPLLMTSIKNESADSTMVYATLTPTHEWLRRLNSVLVINESMISSRCG